MSDFRIDAIKAVEVYVRPDMMDRVLRLRIDTDRLAMDALRQMQVPIIHLEDLTIEIYVDDKVVTLKPIIKVKEELVFDRFEHEGATA